MQRKLILGALALALIAPVTAAQAQNIILNVSSWVPPSHLITADVIMPLCKDIETNTQGRVKCNLLPKAVVAPPQTFDAVRDGLADLSYSAHGYTPGRFIATDVAEFTRSPVISFRCRPVWRRSPTVHLRGNPRPVHRVLDIGRAPRPFVLYSLESS